MIGNPSAHVNQQNIDYQDKNQAVAYYEVALAKLYHRIRVRRLIAAIFVYKTDITGLHMCITNTTAY
jgi:hypothetical protein